MKRLYWNPLDNELIEGSIWERVTEEYIHYDQKHFELHFQVRQARRELPMDEQKGGQGMSDSRRNILYGNQKITFIAKKRTQDVMDGLKDLKMNNNELRKVLLGMDESRIDTMKLGGLLKIVPTLEEQLEVEKKIIWQGTKNINDYGDVEQFFYGLHDFYRLENRLKLWMFKQNFNEIYDSLMDQYKIIGKACNKLRSCKSLKMILSIILTFGNHMNNGSTTFILSVQGFNLNILTKMTEVTTHDNTRSLLMYIYDFCDKKYSDALNILPELEDVLKDAATIDIGILKKAYQRVKDNMDDIGQLINSEEIENYKDVNDRFIEILSQFYNDAMPRMKEFNLKAGEVMIDIKRVMSHFRYGTDDNPKSIESFFAIWWKFIQDFGASKDKLIKLEKERQRRIEKRKKAKNMQKRKELHQRYGSKGKNEMGLPLLHKQSTIGEELEKQGTFKQYKRNAHDKLKGMVKRKSQFLETGGNLDGLQQNNTMKRLSNLFKQEVKKQEDIKLKRRYRGDRTIFNDQSDELKAITLARNKANIMGFNNNNNININNNHFNKRKSSGGGRSRGWTTSVSPTLSGSSASFDIPDNKTFMVPTRRDTNMNNTMDVPLMNGQSTSTPNPINHYHNNGYNGQQYQQQQMSYYRQRSVEEFEELHKLRKKSQDNGNGNNNKITINGYPANNNNNKRTMLMLKQSKSYENIYNGAENDIDADSEWKQKYLQLKQNYDSLKMTEQRNKELQSTISTITNANNQLAQRINQMQQIQTVKTNSLIIYFTYFR